MANPEAPKYQQVTSEGQGATSHSLSGNLTLTDASAALNLIDGNGAIRDVNLPAEAVIGIGSLVLAVEL